MRSPEARRPGVSLDSETSLSAILFELDAFGELACELGEDSTRRLLGQVPARCNELLSGDTTLRAQEPGTFLVLGLLNEAEATLLAERLKVQFLQRPFAADARMVTTTASFGVATKAANDETREQWLQRVRDALQAAKSRGGNRVEVATVRKRDLPITSNAPEDSRQTGALLPHRGLKAARTPASLLPLDAHAILDPRTLEQLGELADDASFLEQLYASYLESAQHSLRELLQTNDLQVQRNAANLLKGSSMNVGAAAVAAACQELEHGLRMQSNSVDVGAWVQVIEKELQRVRAAWNAVHTARGDA